MTKILQIKEYRVYYKSLSGYVRAVDGVDLEITSGVIHGVIGESGCGKSTLVHSIVFPKYPMVYRGGDVIFKEQYNLPTLRPETRKNILLTHLSYIPQFALDALPLIKKIRSLLYDIAKEKNVPYEEVFERFKERLKQVNLPERVLNMYPLELSGGMRQRVVIAFSTLFKPSLLIADEPTSALDVVTQRQVLELMRDLRDQKIVDSLLIISHDIASIRQIADRISTMYAGKIVETGDLEDTIKDPLHPYTKMLVEAVPPIGVSYRNRRLRGLRGSPPSLLNPPSGCRFHPRCPSAMPICTNEEPRQVRVGNSVVACWLYSSR